MVLHIINSLHDQKQYAVVLLDLRMYGYCNEIQSVGVHYSIQLGAVSIRKTVLPGMTIPMLKIRRPNGRLIFNMEIAIRR